jgi:uncharacterized membrane protein YeaQ/YmgE (transglycosylase-associated protein family)
MSYLFIVMVGAVAGWIAGQYLKGSEQGPMVDVAAGAVGAVVFVLISRLVGPAAAAGFMMSAFVAILGAFGAVYGHRQFVKTKPVPVVRRRR